MVVSRQTFVAVTAAAGIITCPCAALAQEARVSFRVFPFAPVNQSPPISIEIRGSPSSPSLPSFTLSKTDKGPQLTGLQVALPSIGLGKLTLAPRYGDQRVTLDFLPSALSGMSIDARSMRGLSIATTAGSSSWTLMLGQLPTASANLLDSSVPNTLAFTGTLKPRRGVSIAPRLISRLGAEGERAPQTSLGSGVKVDAGRNVAVIADLGFARNDSDRPGRRGGPLKRSAKPALAGRVAERPDPGGGGWSHLAAAGAIGTWSRTRLEASLRRGERTFTLLGSVPFAAEDRELVTGRVLLSRGLTLSGETGMSRPAGLPKPQEQRVSRALALTVERFRAGRLVVSNERTEDRSRTEHRQQLEWRHRHRDGIIVRYLQRQETAKNGNAGPSRGRLEVDVRSAPRYGQRFTADLRTLLVFSPAEQVPLLTSRVKARLVLPRVRLGSEAELTMFAGAFQAGSAGVVRALRVTSETPLLRDTSLELSYEYQQGASLPLARRLEARLTRVVRLSRK